ncbi:MAG: flagellar transcriptional regulator FlhD [Gammaproteobacteria bacterium]|nr:flagellar transcriptional regulator FlhD [Gammaproteobacteria bacterium]
MPLVDREIVNLNLFWLIKARELARDNPGKAAVVLGLDAGLVNKLTALNLDDLNRIAHAGVLLFRPRFRLALWRQLINRDNTPSLSIRLQTLLMAASEKSS